jgi:hypothetical protein
MGQLLSNFEPDDYPADLRSTQRLDQVQPADAPRPQAFRACEEVT